MNLATGWFILGTLSTERADGFSGVFDARNGSASGPAVGLEWASFEVITTRIAEPDAAPT
jgi:hypothetical protein